MSQEKNGICIICWIEPRVFPCINLNKIGLFHMLFRNIVPGSPLLWISMTTFLPCYYDPFPVRVVSLLHYISAGLTHICWRHFCPRCTRRLFDYFEVIEVHPDLGHITVRQLSGEPAVLFPVCSVFGCCPALTLTRSATDTLHTKHIISFICKLVLICNDVKNCC